MKLFFGILIWTFFVVGVYYIVFHDDTAHGAFYIALSAFNYCSYLNVKKKDE